MVGGAQSCQCPVAKEEMSSPHSHGLKAEPVRLRVKRPQPGKSPCFRGEGGRLLSAEPSFIERFIVLVHPVEPLLSH